MGISLAFENMGIAAALCRRFYIASNPVWCGDSTLLM